MTKKGKILIASIIGAILSALAGLLSGDTVKGVFTKEPANQDRKAPPVNPGVAPKSSMADPVQLDIFIGKV